jgi:hypothetical protein
MHTSQNITPPSSKFGKMVSEQDIKKAINTLDAQLIPNYSQVAKDFGIKYITLIQRHKYIYPSRQEVIFLYYKLLTNMQEEALISQINKLIVCKLSPILQIIRNLIEEIISYNIGKN